MDDPKEKPFKLPEIYIAEDYDTIEGEDGNVGFGVYVPDENRIYVAGDVEDEIRTKALLHEICHWVQDMCGRPFDEDEANKFAEVVYDALPEIIRCKDCAKKEYCRTSTVWAIPPKDDWYCGDAERRIKSNGKENQNS